MEGSLEDDIAPRNSDDSSCRKSFSADSDCNQQSTGFDCNICLDAVQDPVVTLCGHLYCWPCIYKWLEPAGKTPEGTDQPHQCPVCKAEISHTDLIPLYGRGQATRNSKAAKARQLEIGIPRRPPSPVFGANRPRSVSTASAISPSQELYGRAYLSRSLPYSSHSAHFRPPPVLFSNTRASMIHPIVGIFGELVNARVFGNSVTNVYTYPDVYHVEGSSPRVRRLVMQADKSLSRISFFLLCCCIICLLLF